MAANINRRDFLKMIAAGVALHYLAETQHSKLEHITGIHRLMEDEYVWMDRFTMNNLELHRPSIPGGVCLLDIIDKTVSPMGSRMMKRWLALPLKNPERIRNRHEIVKFLIPSLREHIFKENNILYPTALEAIDDAQVWVQLKRDCDRVGYCCFRPTF